MKLFQSTTARWLVWLTVKVLAVWLMLAWPAATWPPVGNWLLATAVCAANGNGKAIPKLRMLKK